MILSFSVLDELPYTWTISLRGHSENLPALRKKIDNWVWKSPTSVWLVFLFPCIIKSSLPWSSGFYYSKLNEWRILTVTGWCSLSLWKLSWSYCEIRTHDSDGFDHWQIYWLIYTQWRTFKLSFNGTIWQTVIHTNQKYKQSNLPPLTPTSPLPCSFILSIHNPHDLFPPLLILTKDYLRVEMNWRSIYYFFARRIDEEKEKFSSRQIWPVNRIPVHWNLLERREVNGL